MKFTVRDGFVVRLINYVQLAEGKVEGQEVNYYPGQEFELKPQQVDDHAHKLEPIDKEASKYLASKVVSPPPAVAAGTSAVDVQAIATAAAIAAVQAMQAQAAGTAPT